MSRVLSNSKLRDALFGGAILTMLVSLLLFPTQAVEAARDGVSISINVILPSLFPFFVLSTLCVELGLVRTLGKLLRPVMRPLFRVSGSCAGAFLLGIVGGYPVGARTAIELYRKNQCSRTEAERMLSFCNNSGPAFILGVVGAGVFSSSSAGLWLYGAHVAASILVGLLFRFYRRKEAPVSAALQEVRTETHFADAFTGSVRQALTATLSICGFVIFFTVLIRLLFLTDLLPKLAYALTVLLGRFGLRQSWAESLLTGAIEMTSGVWSLRDMAGAMGDKLCMAAFILGWAGLSVHCQVLSFIGSSGLSTRTYFFGKLLHGLISAVLIFLLSRLLGWNRPVSTYLATQVGAIAGLRFSRALSVSTAVSLTVLLSLLVIYLGFLIRDYGNRRKNRV